MDELFLQLAVQARGKIRTATLHGRDFRVVPAVLVQEQVLRNNLGATFLPGEEITDAFASAANGAPVLTDHPVKRGLPASGRTPEIMNEIGVGFLFNVRAEPGRLIGDVWIDPTRAADVGDLTAILERLEGSETVELSTGFKARIEATKGVFNGESYDLVIRPMGFDHLAIFARKTGACSVEDGCGLGVNEEAGTPPEPQDARDDLAEVYNALGITDTKPADDPPGGTAPEEGQSMNRAQLIAALVSVVALSKEDLEKLTECELKALHSAHNSGGEPPEPEPGSEEASWKERALNWRRKAEELQQRFSGTIENEREERLGLIEDLANTKRHVAWSPAEIEKMEIADLRRVHRQVFGGSDFTARGGPVVGNEGGSFDSSFVKPLFPAKEA